MRSLKILILFYFISVQGYAQKFSYPVNTSEEELTVEVIVAHTELTITGTSNSQIEINSLKDVKASDSRADGLAPVTPWPDNTGLGIHISENGSSIQIIKSDRRSRAKFEMSIPELAMVKIVETEWGGGNFKISGLMRGVDIESTNSDITITNTSGAIHAETTSGDINITIPSGIGNGYDISTVSGTIDISIQKQRPYSFDLSTISGSVHTDFELDQTKEYKGSILHRIGRVRDVETDLNGGADLIRANTVSGILNILFIK